VFQVVFGGVFYDDMVKINRHICTFFRVAKVKIIIFAA
jgi:hypothetical protein